MKGPVVSRWPFSKCSEVHPCGDLADVSANQGWSCCPNEVLLHGNNGWHWQNEVGSDGSPSWLTRARQETWEIMSKGSTEVTQQRLLRVVEYIFPAHWLAVSNHVDSFLVMTPESTPVLMVVNCCKTYYLVPKARENELPVTDVPVSVLLIFTFHKTYLKMWFHAVCDLATRGSRQWPTLCCGCDGKKPKESSWLQCFQLFESRNKKHFVWLWHVIMDPKRNHGCAFYDYCSCLLLIIRASLTSSVVT